MPPEQNQQGGRRPHYHRGRRGSDRRGPDRRNLPQPQPEPGGRDGGRDPQDVEQIMREIRARISQRHGIELTTQQIQELAARRLEAILDPPTVDPSLLEQLRRNAGKAPEIAAAPPAYEFEDRTIYESHNGLLRFIRRLLNPILKLFFNPNPIAHALNAQTRINAELAAREVERDRRQAEWNALHYDILQRLVTETARVSIEMQSLAQRVEALGARVDFNDRRVRLIEANAQPARSQQRPPEPRQTEPRQPETRQPEPRAAVAAPAGAAPSPEVPASTEARPADGAGTEASRRRRRRRRGRRSGIVPGEAAGAGAEAQLPDADADAGEGTEFDDAGDDEAAPGADAGPASSNGTLRATAGDAEPHPGDSSVAAPAAASGVDAGTPDVRTETAPRSASRGAPVSDMTEAAPVAAHVQESPEPATEALTAAAAPAPYPEDREGAATTPPSPPRDEPASGEPPPEAEQERGDR